MQKLFYVASLLWVLAAAGVAQAQSVSERHPGEDSVFDGIATTVGPQFGLYGPPTALKIQLHYWHDFDEMFGFYATTGLMFSGEALIEGDEGLPDARHDSTFGAGFGAGVRIGFDLGIEPLELYSRVGLAFSMLTAGDLVGYMMGPSTALGFRYDIVGGFGLLVEADSTLGYGQYQGAGNTFAWTLDVLAGVQVQW